MTINSKKYAAYNTLHTNNTNTLVQNNLIHENIKDLSLTYDNFSITAPYLLNSRSELNKLTYITQENWKSKQPKARLEISSPVGFPKRKELDFLFTREQELENAKAIKVPTVRNCREAEIRNEQELEEKRKAMAIIRAQRIIQRQLMKEKLKKLNTREIDKNKDENPKSPRFDTGRSERDAPKEPILKEPIKPKEFKVYKLDPEPKIVREIICDVPAAKVPIRKPVSYPLFLHFENNMLNEQDSIEININQFVKDLTEKFVTEQQFYTTPQKPNDMHAQELVVVLPKLYDFGEKELKNIEPSEYTKHFCFYKMDPVKVIEFLVQNLKDKEITMRDLKDLLTVIGMPIHQTEEVKKYKSSFDNVRKTEQRAAKLREENKKNRLKNISQMEEYKNEEKMLTQKQKLINAKIRERHKASLSQNSSISSNRSSQAHHSHKAHRHTRNENISAGSESESKSSIVHKKPYNKTQSTGNLHKVSKLSATSLKEKIKSNEDLQRNLTSSPDVLLAKKEAKPKYKKNSSRRHHKKHKEKEPIAFETSERALTDNINNEEKNIGNTTPIHQKKNENEVNLSNVKIKEKMQQFQKESESEKNNKSDINDKSDNINKINKSDKIKIPKLNSEKIIIKSERKQLTPIHSSNRSPRNDSRKGDINDNNISNAISTNSIPQTSIVSVINEEPRNITKVGGGSVTEGLMNRESEISDNIIHREVIEDSSNSKVNPTSSITSNPTENQKSSTIEAQKLDLQESQIRADSPSKISDISPVKDENIIKQKTKHHKDKNVPKDLKKDQKTTSKRDKSEKPKQAEKTAKNQQNETSIKRTTKKVIKVSSSSNMGKQSSEDNNEVNKKELNTSQESMGQSIAENTEILKSKYSDDATPRDSDSHIAKVVVKKTHTKKRKKTPKPDAEPKTIKEPKSKIANSFAPKSRNNKTDTKSTIANTATKTHQTEKLERSSTLPPEYEHAQSVVKSSAPPSSKNSAVDVSNLQNESQIKEEEKQQSDTSNPNSARGILKAGLTRNFRKLMRNQLGLGNANSERSIVNGERLSESPREPVAMTTPKGKKLKPGVAEKVEEEEEEGEKLVFRSVYDDEDLLRYQEQSALKSENPRTDSKSQLSDRKMNPLGQKSIEELKKNLNDLKNESNLKASGSKIKASNTKTRLTDTKITPISEAEEIKKQPPSPPRPRVVLRAQQQTEEEKKLEEEYKKLIEDMQRLEEEKIKKDQAAANNNMVKEAFNNALPQKVEDKPETPETPESSDSEENINSVDKMLKHLKNPRRMGMMLDKLHKNEEIKNIVLQLQQTDIDKLEAVQNTLQDFFNEKEFPEFYRSKLKDSKFTPFIDFTGVNEKAKVSHDNFENTYKAEPTWEELKESYNKAKLQEIAERKALENVQGVIRAHGLEHKLKVFDDKVSEILDSVSEALVDGTGNKMDLTRKFEVLKDQLWAVEHIMKLRTQQLSHLKEAHDNLLKKKIPTVSLKKLELKEDMMKDKKYALTTDARYEIQGGKTTLRKKKYKVNMTLLQKREGMSQLEIMERRYKVISGEEI